MLLNQREVPYYYEGLNWRLCAVKAAVSTVGDAPAGQARGDRKEIGPHLNRGFAASQRFSRELSATGCSNEVSSPRWRAKTARAMRLRSSMTTAT